MELVDAVIGAESLAGRKLTDSEMKLVQTILSRKLSAENTWNQIWGLLDLSVTHVVMRATALRLASAGDGAARVLQDDTEYRIKKAGL